jgi:ankyrin repeat protein
MVLTAKADVNARTLNDKHTALHAAAARGRTDMVQMLLAVRARLDLADAGWQFTPLMEAARSGHEDVMRLLVRAGASIQGGLHAAASGGHVHVARFLLGIKADVDGPGAQGQRGQALVAAINCGRNEKQHALLRLLLHAKANARGAANPQHTNPAIWAAWNGNVCALRLLLRAKADLAAETSAFAIDLPLRTPALVAAHHGFADVLRFLLKVKVDIWRENAKLLAPRLAVKCNHAYALGVLLDAKADPNFCWEGPDFTLAMCVVGIANSTRAQGLKWQGRADVLRVLVQAKADLERYNPAFGTVACRAAAGGCVDVLQVLVDARCNLETRTVQGDTPLCLATSARQEAAVRVLIHAKADVNAADAQGRPAWELAAEWRSGELVTLMLSAKADIDARAGARAELAKWYTA